MQFQQKMRQLLTILLLGLSLSSFSLGKIDSTKIVGQQTVSTKDTLVNELSIKSPLILENKQGFDFWTNMPWLTAFLIGAITLYLGHRQLKSNEGILREQINSARDIARLDFNKTVISGNRQEWINTLRENVSEYLGLTESRSSIFWGIADSAKYQELSQANLASILRLEAKIVLMLNSTEEESKELIRILRLYTRSTFNKSVEQTKEELNQRTIELTKKILKSEWERVKKGE